MKYEKEKKNQTIFLNRTKIDWENDPIICITLYILTGVAHSAAVTLSLGHPSYTGFQFFIFYFNFLAVLVVDGHRYRRGVGNTFSRAWPFGRH